jgi:pyridoxal phosphate enzyme (YggS family)
VARPESGSGPAAPDPGEDSAPDRDLRSAQLARALDVVRGRIRDGCAAAARDSSDVTLVVVTKTHPAADVRRLAGLGVRDVGESRDAEAAPKAASLVDLPLTWHFVGQLQTNKVRSVVRYAGVVHSVDRPGLVAALGAAADRAAVRVGCFLQVSLDGDPARGGVLPAELLRLADQLAGRPALDLLGVMAVAPLDEDPPGAFARLREASDRLRVGHPAATRISAGMSGDLEAALACGATHLRVGTGVLGPRPSLQ